jgi:hypothetical protein
MHSLRNCPSDMEASSSAPRMIKIRPVWGMAVMVSPSDHSIGCVLKYSQARFGETFSSRSRRPASRKAGLYLCFPCDQSAHPTACLFQSVCNQLLVLSGPRRLGMKNLATLFPKVTIRSSIEVAAARTRPQAGRFR